MKTTCPAEQDLSSPGGGWAEQWYTLTHNCGHGHQTQQTARLHLLKVQASYNSALHTSTHHFFARPVWGSYRPFCVQSLWWHLTLSWQFWVTQTDSSGAGQCLVWPWAQLNQHESIRIQLKSEPSWWSKSKPDLNRHTLFLKISEILGERYSRRMRFKLLQNRFRKLRIWLKKEGPVLPCTRYEQYSAWNTLLSIKVRMNSFASKLNMSIWWRLSFFTMSDDVHLQDETKTRAFFSGDHGWQWRCRQECAHTSGINYQGYKLSGYKLSGYKLSGV